jgi:anti-sigma factor RsiW
MTLLSQLAAIAAIVGTGVVYGTDVFSALVQRPALARLRTCAASALPVTASDRVKDVRIAASVYKHVEQDRSVDVQARAGLRG